MCTLDLQYTQREIRQTTVEEVAKTPYPACFIKPALAKVDEFPARWHTRPTDVAQAALQNAVHPQTALQYTVTSMNFEYEWRTYVLDGFACKPSLYKKHGENWEPWFDQSCEELTRQAWHYAETVTDDLYHHRQAPRAYVLDVGLTTTGQWVVIEANAPWASNPYGCPLTEVVDVLAASFAAATTSAWKWTPDPHEQAWADKLPVLAVAQDTYLA